jgi:hypothetical protein
MTLTGPEGPPITRRCGAIGNRLVGILHGCLAHQVTYQAQVAWPLTELAA